MLFYAFSARTDFFDDVSKVNNIYTNGVFTVESCDDEFITTLTAKLSADDAQKWATYFESFDDENSERYGGAYLKNLC